MAERTGKSAGKLRKGGTSFSTCFAVYYRKICLEFKSDLSPNTSVGENDKNVVLKMAAVFRYIVFQMYWYLVHFS